jgi:hypothetical protein
MIGVMTLYNDAWPEVDTANKHKGANVLDRKLNISALIQDTEGESFMSVELFPSIDHEFDDYEDMFLAETVLVPTKQFADDINNLSLEDFDMSNVPPEYLDILPSEYDPKGLMTMNDGSVLETSIILSEDEPVDPEDITVVDGILTQKFKPVKLERGTKVTAVSNSHLKIEMLTDGRLIDTDVGVCYTESQGKKTYVFNGRYYVTENTKVPWVD